MIQERNSDATCAAGFVRSLMDYAQGRGADRAALLEAAGIDADAFADPDARIPFPRYVSLMRAAKRMLDDPALALRFGEDVQMADVSIVGLIGRASADMHTALTQLGRYVPLIVDVPLTEAQRFVFRRQGGALWYVDTRAEPNTFPELTESAFAHIVTPPRIVGIPEWVKEVQFTHADPGYADVHARLFPCPVRFSQARNAMRVDEAMVTRRVELLPAFAFGVLTDRAETMLEALTPETNVRSQVERLLLPILHTGDASIEAIAVRMGVSRQTLWRTLRREGVTFESVLDGLRHRLALDYLAARKTSINEIAYLVGFSDPAAFSRAFKRWTGHSPSAARRGQGAGPV